METDTESYDPIIINKTYEQQKDDLLKILYYDEPLMCSQVCEHWKNTLDVVVEPVGWTALWKISRDICCKFGVLYPTTAIVEVQNVDFKNFLADVCVIVAEDNSNIPKRVPDVPLIQLFPTVQQDYRIIDVYKTAYILHDLRVFFIHLWYPWDEKFCGNEDWLPLHFEDRLRLHYDILSGQIDPKVRFTIESLIKEGKDVHQRIVQLEEQLIDLDSGIGSHPDQQDVVTTDMRFLSLYELQVKLNHISEQLNFYEKKNIRDLVEKKEKIKKIDEINTVQFGWCRGTPAEFSLFVNKVGNYLPSTDTRFECSYSLNKLLSEWKFFKSGEVYLGKGDYCLNSRTVVNPSDGIIQGIDNCGDIIIKDSEEGLCLFDIASEELKFSDLVFKTTEVKYILVVRSGKCYLKNVKIINNDKTEIGVYVVSGAQLIADDCHFYNCSAAIHADKNSSVILTNCVFENNINGLEFEEGSISVDSCQFTNNTGFALLMENSDSLCLNIKKGNDVLEDFQGMKIVDTTFSGNKIDMAKCY